MKLHLRRSQRDAGLLGNNVIFALSARVTRSGNGDLA
jgi:hypothetical protein